MALQDSKIIAERIRQYGNNFPMIAKLFNQYFKMNGLNMSRDITEYDVCMLMGLMKISRISANPDHEDSIIDMMNYFNIGFNFEEYKQLVNENTCEKQGEYVTVNTSLGDDFLLNVLDKVEKILKQSHQRII